MRAVLAAIGTGLLFGCTLSAGHASVQPQPRPRPTPDAHVAAEPVLFFQGLAGCSASFIGQRVVLTAAHCVADRARLALTRQSPAEMVALSEDHRFSIPGAGTTTGRCVIHRDYIKTGQGDVALCQTTSRLRVQPFRVDQNAALLAPNRLLLLEGFAFLNQTNRRPLRQIRAVVRGAAPSELIRTSNDPILAGDSGGPALASVNTTSRVVVGVISRGDAREGEIAPLSGPVASALLSLWSQTMRTAPICGLKEEGCSP